MKEQVITFQSVDDAIWKIIIPALRSGSKLSNSIPLPLKGVNLSLRELLGLALVCKVGNYLTGLEWTISSDPMGRDGIAYCLEVDREGDGIPFEQVYVSDFSRVNNLQEGIIKAIQDKSSKGESYGQNYGLIVFCDKDGQINIPDLIEYAGKSPFSSCWLISKYNPNDFVYYVAMIKSSSGDPLGEYIIKFNLSNKKTEINKR